MIEHTAERLPLYPHLYRAGRRPDTQEVVVDPNDIFVYRVRSSEIEIISVLHAPMLYP